MLDVVELSRLQFALTALYHFIFVPLTLGLSFVLVIMETTYVVTGKEVYKDMTKFWGKLFGINFALGVTTGIIMEFQFGTNWSYYSHYVGDIFGAPLAIEALLAFFLESTFVGLFFFGWDRLTKGKHLLATYCVAFGSNLSAMWILVANGWMQSPTGSEFNFEIIETPGHSRGDICYYDKVNKILISGDTMFQGTYGRVDLPTSNPIEMGKSLKKLLALDEDIKVYPGHGFDTTIGQERRYY